MTVSSESSPPVAGVSQKLSIFERSEWPFAILAIAVFSLMSITLAKTSTGFLEGDSCSHFLIARTAWTNLAYFANVWGRPACTGFYAIPIHFGGLMGARIASLLAAIIVSLLTRSIAFGQGYRWPTLAMLFLLAQPLVFLHSFSELTELPFALIFTTALWAYQRRQFFLFALALGFGPLSRPEGFGFIALGFFALLLHRRWWWSFLLVLPMLAWDYFGWRVNACPGIWWQWLANNWPWSKESLYERGNILHFVGLLPVVVSPFLLPAMLIGTWLCLRGEHFRSIRNWISEAFGKDQRRRVDMLIAGMPWCLLLGHSLLYTLGKMASNGEVRYMMVTAPMWALLAARGYVWIFQSMRWPRPFLYGAFFSMLPLLANRIWTVLPLGLSPDWTEAQQIADWYKTGTLQKQYPRLDISHVGLLYALDFDPQSRRIIPWTKPVIHSRPTGTLLIWDRVGALFNSDENRKITLDEIRAAGWKPLKTFWTGGAGQWQFFLSDPEIPSPTTAP
jgi:hypothetical protein